MRNLLLATLAVLWVAPQALAQDVQEYTDSQGVQTFTNLPASKDKAPVTVKDQHGVKVLSNVPPGKRKRHHYSPDSEAAAEASAAPAAAPLEPPSAPAYGVTVMPAEPVSTPSASADGQWVYTDQYGWLWMPYGNQYVDEGSSDGEEPYAYAYDPDDGWGWLAAPWVWGWGPYPYFGALGPGRFGWYRGLTRAGYGWGGYRGGGPGHVGYARASYRGGFGVGGGHYGRGFGGGFGARFRGGGAFHGGGGFHGSARRSFGGGGGGFGGHGGGGHGGGGHGGGGHR